MGHPKGLCRLPGDERPLVLRILDLYRPHGWSAVVVIRQEDEPGYRHAIGGTAADLLVCKRGGDTARTLHHVLVWQKENAQHITHLWAHPVDLPTVRPATVRALLTALAQDRPAALRPAHEGKPGHPAVLTVPALAAVLQTDPGEGKMHDIWQGAGVPPMTTLDVDDPGVVQDFDTAAALEAAPYPKDGSP